MSSDPTAPGAPGAPGAAPSEAELRAAYEAELSRITATEMMLQAAASLLNIAAIRLAPGAGEPDLEQVRDGIDAVRALLEILERRIPREVRSLRDALSQLQVAYAREVQASVSATRASTSAAGGDARTGETAQPGGDSRAGEPADEQRGPGPAESSGRLWVPGR